MQSFAGLCLKCLGVGKDYYTASDVLRDRERKRQQFADSFWEGFNEADQEIRNANPHIYGEPKWASGYSSNQFWEDINRTNQRINEEVFGKKRKQPWPKPEIFWLPDFNGWRVKDSVTEGYVDVPVEAVEAILGRGIEQGLRARVIYRAEIEECAKRLLILLIYGCPPKLCAPKPEPPSKSDEEFRKFAREIMKDFGMKNPDSYIKYSWL